MSSSSFAVEISKVRDGVPEALADSVAVEEPLEIRLGYTTPDGRATRSISITMRTPGNDSGTGSGVSVHRSHYPTQRRHRINRNLRSAGAGFRQSQRDSRRPRSRCRGRSRPATTALLHNLKLRRLRQDFARRAARRRRQRTRQQPWPLQPSDADRSPGRAASSATYLRKDRRLARSRRV